MHLIDLCENNLGWFSIYSLHAQEKKKSDVPLMIFSHNLQVQLYYCVQMHWFGLD